MKEIKDWYWTMDEWNDTLYIWVVDINDNELLASEISGCENLSVKELDELTEETLQNLDYKIVGV